MIRSLEIENFKSISSLERTEFGRFNVLIGENGSGKSNLVEAIALLSSAKTNRLTQKDLVERGVRVARPSLTLSAFIGKRQGPAIRIKAEHEEGRVSTISEAILSCEDKANSLAEWKDTGTLPIRQILAEGIKEFNGRNAEKSESKRPEVAPADDPNAIWGELIEYMKGYYGRVRLESGAASRKIEELVEDFDDFVIYSLDTLALRGFNPQGSLLEPVGLHGERLDELISSVIQENKEGLRQYYRLVSWLSDIEVDHEDTKKESGFKLGVSQSLLYFKDKYMARGNNIFSAENANEGALHMLFYFSVFLSKRTPKIFAIDNIEQCLNPRLCTELTRALVSLCKTTDRQVFVTTHNPAVLDGLDLNDKDTFLFVISRSDTGRTVMNRIKLKPNEGKNYKLSELWMRGSLGALPKSF